MNRLTIKNSMIVVARNHKKTFMLTEEYKKLQQLEDLEEELGIDLLTLFKAVKEGVLINNKKSWVPNCQLSYIKSDDNYALILAGLYICKLKDYGKTWALTREELEDDEKED